MSQQPAQPHSSRVGNGFVIWSLGMCPHVRVVLQAQGGEQGGNSSSTEPPDPLPSALPLTAMARGSSTPRALARTNSSVLSSLSSTSDALLFPKDYSSCSSTTIKAPQLRTGLTEAAPPQGGKEVLPMKALSSLAASGTVIRLICAGSTGGEVFLAQAPPREKGELPLPLCSINEDRAC